MTPTHESFTQDIEDRFAELAAQIAEAERGRQPHAEFESKVDERVKHVNDNGRDRHNSAGAPPVRMSKAERSDARHFMNEYASSV